MVLTNMCLALKIDFCSKWAKLPLVILNLFQNLKTLK